MSAQESPLDAQRLHQLLADVDRRLAERHSTAILFVVGGAAMALGYDATRSTHDIDALFRPSPVVREVAKLVGEDHGLAPDWLNDAAKGFLPGADDEPRTVFESAHLRVQVPSPEYLLAMKLFSGRGSRDVDDSIRLAQLTGLTSQEQLLDLLSSKYPAQLLLPKHRYFAMQVAAMIKERETMTRAQAMYEAAMPASTLHDPSKRKSDTLPPHLRGGPQQHRHMRSRLD